MSFEPITGRYLTITVQGRSQRIYVEMAGQGIPVPFTTVSVSMRTVALPAET